jgi:hypothetical protein
MTVPEFEQAAYEGHERRAAGPSAPGKPRKTRLDCVLWVFGSSVLFAAAVLVTAAYWGYVLVRPDPLFAPSTSVDSRAARPASGA